MMRSILFIAIVAVLAGGFMLNRFIETNRLHSEFDRVNREKIALQQAVAETADLEKNFSGDIDVAAVTEALYACALKAGIKNHVVTTRDYSPGREMRSRSSRKQSLDLKIHRLQVDMDGSFRRIANYVRNVQQLDLRKRITHIDLIPGEKQLEATITIDLFSLGENNGQ